MEESRQAAIVRALRDPAYHRAKFARKPLYWPQARAVQVVEEAIAKARAQTICIRSSRQTMKNECAALVHIRHLIRRQRVGGNIIRTAPTYIPQVVNSKRRLETEVSANKFFLNARNIRHREGGFVELGAASVQFLSTDPGAKTEGATASTLLDIDEAHLVDKGSFEAKFGPMTAFFAPPTVLWGVAAAKDDLLYQYASHVLGEPPPAGQYVDRTTEHGTFLQFPASLWCELRPAYRLHYESRVALLGPDNPFILTQYDLVDQDAVGGFLKQRHIASISGGDHPARFRPRASGRDEMLEYVAIIDIGGEDEEGEEADAEGMIQAKRDSTVARIIEVNHHPKAIVHGIPKCREVWLEWWIGKQFAADPTTGLPGQQESLLRLLQHWRVSRYVVDGRGVGAQIAKFLIPRHRGGLCYEASSGSVSEDCYGFLAIVSNGQYQLWQQGQYADDVPLPQREKLALARAESMRQCGWTRGQIVGHDQYRIAKPKGRGPDGQPRHIDHVKAMTYLSRVLSLPVPPRPGLIARPTSFFG